jgi:hypothetical protein
MGVGVLIDHTLTTHTNIPGIEGTYASGKEHMHLYTIFRDRVTSG